MRKLLLALPLVFLLTACGGSAPSSTPATTSSDPAVQAMVDFGQCLKDKGAAFYGTDWCPHCKTQRATLGDALASINETDCDLQKALCTKKKITGYPTWVLADNSRLVGSQSLQQLGAATGCVVPPA